MPLGLHHYVLITVNILIVTLYTFQIILYSFIILLARVTDNPSCERNTLSLQNYRLSYLLVCVSVGRAGKCVVVKRLIGSKCRLWW